MKVVQRIYRAYLREDVVKYCTDIIEKRCKEIKNLEVVTTADMLAFKNDEE